MNIRFPFFIIVITFCLFGLFSLFYVDGAHDGIVFIPAREVLHGKVLFRETFTQYGWLFTVIHAFGLLVFGEHMLSLRLTTLIFYSLTAVVLWEVYKRFLPKSWNILAFVLWLSLSPVYWWFFHPWSSVQAAFFQCLSMLLYIRYIEKQQIRYLFFAGFSSVLTFWCRQPVGIVHTIAIFGITILLYPDKTCVRRLLPLAGGAFLGFFPVIIWLIHTQALTDWWLQSMLMQIPFAEVTRGISVNQIARSLLATRYWKTLYFHWIWIVIPLSNVLICIYSLYRTRTNVHLNHSKIVFLVSGIGVASWHQYYPVTERLHFFWSVTPMIGVFIFVLYRLKKHMLPIFFIAVCMHLLWGIVNGWDRVRKADTFTSAIIPMRGIFIPKEFKTFVEDVSGKMDMFFSLYPDQTYINDTNIAFYPLFFPDRFHAFDGVYVNWDRITSAIYPNLVLHMQEYIARKRPLIFTRYPHKYPDYCDLNVVTLEDPPVYLLAPKEAEKELNCL